MRFVEQVLRWMCVVAGVAMLASCASSGSKKAEPPAATTAASASPPAAAPASEPATPTPAVAQPAPPPPIAPDVQRAFDAARQALAAGRMAEAERGFIALTKSHPELAGPHANLGLIYRQAGKNKEAISALEQAVQLSPQRADLHNQLGIAYRMAGEFPKAKASYEQATTLDAAYAPAVLNLGILYDLYLWDGQRALELYDRYLQLAPGGDEQVKRWISDLRNRSSQKNAAQRKEQG